MKSNAGIRALAGLVATLLAACSDDSMKTGPLAEVPFCASFTSALVVTDDTTSQQSTTIPSGDLVGLALKITYTGTAGATLDYDGCPSARFTVLDPQGHAVLDTLPDNTACTLQNRFITYSAGQSQSSNVEWDQHAGDGSGQVPAGTYTVKVHDRSAECAGALDSTGSFTIQ